MGIAVRQFEQIGRRRVQRETFHDKTGCCRVGPWFRRPIGLPLEILSRTLDVPDYLLLVVAILHINLDIQKLLNRQIFLQTANDVRPNAPVELGDTEYVKHVSARKVQTVFAAGRKMPRF